MAEWLNKKSIQKGSKRERKVLHIVNEKKTRKNG